jgi:hypothetical protein
MSQLGPDARALLDAARGEDDPTDEDRSRVHGKVLAALATGGAGAAGAGSSTAAQAAGSATGAGATGAGAGGAGATSSAPAATAAATSAAEAVPGAGAGAAAGSGAAGGAGTAGAGGALGAASAGGITAASAGIGSGVAAAMKVVAVVTVLGAAGGTVAVAPWQGGDSSSGWASSAGGGSPAGDRGPPEGNPGVVAADEPSQQNEADDKTASKAGKPEAKAQAEATPARASSDDRSAHDDPARKASASRSDDGVSDVLERKTRRLRARRRAQAPTASGETPDGKDEPAPEPSKTLRAEIDLLREAQTLRRRGEHEKALAQLDAHAEQFSDGALRAERLATRVLVLCDLGRTEQASAVAARFLESSPDSPLAGRVRNSCGGPGSTD